MLRWLRPASCRRCALATLHAVIRPSPGHISTSVCKASAIACLPAGLLLRSRPLLAPTTASSLLASSEASKEDDDSAGSSQLMPVSEAGALSQSSESNTSPTPSHASQVNDHFAPAVLVSASRDITSEAHLNELSNELEQRRQLRQEKLFENLLVFQGGAVEDKKILRRDIIMRDYIHFCLNNIRFGYYPRLFRKYRELMTSGYFDPVPFAALRGRQDYTAYTAKIIESTPSFITPTELFQPYYGWVLAEYLIVTHRAKFDPREPLIVYDIGAGTGALAVSVLDYLAEHFPAEYARCEYHVIEQNPYLVQPLRHRLVHHYHRVHVHHLSMLNWRLVERRRCIILALELFSCLPHDCLLWNAEFICSEQWLEVPQEGNILIATERYRPVRDPVILRYLRYLNWLQEQTYHNLKVLCLTGGRVTLDAPRYGGLTRNVRDPPHISISKALWSMSPFHTAWLPTGQMLLLEVLAQYFPRHHLFAADWSSVRYGMPGYNAPVLQVKIRIARELYMRRALESLTNNAGMVDICFPTDFDHLATVYRNICGPEKEIAMMSHPEFWRVHGGDKTSLFSTHNGYNPLLEDFRQYHVFITHHPAEL